MSSSPFELTSWVRVVATTARAGHTGAVVIRAHGRVARIELVGGRLLCVALDDAEPLGRRLGIDEVIATPFAGALWVAEGRTTVGELLHALRTQMRARLVELTRWSRPTIEITHEIPAPRPFAEAFAVAPMLLDVLRRVPADVTLPTSLERSASLDWWLADGGLLPTELFALDRVVRIDEARSEDEVPAVVQHLFLLGAIRSPRPRGPELSLLVEKSIARRRHAPSSSAIEARAELRRVARQLHPDRFASLGPFHEMSERIIAELTHALHER